MVRRKWRWKFYRDMVEEKLEEETEEKEEKEDNSFDKI